MKKDLGVLTAVFPMPVLMIATYGDDGKVDVMNAAWGQICDYDKIIISLSETHKTVANIRLNKAFTVALADKEHIREADYFGLVSGNDTADKFERSGYTVEKSERVNAPIIEEFPVVMECELFEIIETESIFGVVGKIVNVKAEESILDESGKVDVKKADLVMFDQFRHGYYTIGEKTAQAFSVGLELSKKKE